MPQRSAIDVVPSDLLQERRHRKGNRAADVRQPAMRGDERQAAAAVLSQYTENANGYLVLEVLFSQIFRDVAILTECTDVEFLTRSEGELPLRRKRGNASENRLCGCFELHEQELAVHWDALEFVSIWKDQVGLKLQPALAKSAEHANDVVSGEEVQGWVLHEYRRWAGSASCNRNTSSAADSLPSASRMPSKM